MRRMFLHTDRDHTTKLRFDGGQCTMSNHLRVSASTYDPNQMILSTL